MPKEVTKLGKDVFTSGQVAALMGCAPRTVASMTARGQLKSYRLWEPRGGRRVLRGDLVEFARRQGMTHVLEKLAEQDAPPVLLCGLPRTLNDTLMRSTEFSWLETGSTFEAGRHAREVGLAVLDGSLGSAALEEAIYGFNALGVSTLALAPEDAKRHWMQGAPLVTVLRHPVDPAKVLAVIREALGVKAERNGHG